MAGYEYMLDKLNSFDVRVQGAVSDKLPVLDAGTSNIANYPKSTRTRECLISYFGRVNYDYGGRYLLAATMRIDGSSKFAAGHRWGYFPECRVYDDFQWLQEHKNPRSLLWAGRFLDWKHPGDAVAVVHRLAAEGVDVRLQLTGAGPLEEDLRRQIGEDSRITLTGPMRPKQVRHCMEQAGVFLFTSDRREGWGAVVNEAMNSGCAVVASWAAGSVPYLLRDGINGLVYPSGDREALYRRLRMLLDDEDMQHRMGKASLPHCYRGVERR